jgi:hypothetical protein
VCRLEGRTSPLSRARLHDETAAGAVSKICLLKVNVAASAASRCDYFKIDFSCFDAVEICEKAVVLFSSDSCVTQDGKFV